MEDLLRMQYDGIRPAFGYPALRDHSQKELLFQLLNGEEIGVQLTESYMMQPGASVSGLYFGSKESAYFDINRIDGEQFEDYLSRNGKPAKELEQIFGSLLDR